METLEMYGILDRNMEVHAEVHVDGHIGLHMESPEMSTPQTLFIYTVGLLKLQAPSCISTRTA